MSVITDLIDENSECHRRIAELEAVLYAERIDADGQRREFDAATQNIAGLRAELAALKAQEPVMSARDVITSTIGFEFLPGELQTVNSDDLVAVVHAARLYAAPVVSAEQQWVADGWKLVPVVPTMAMLDARRDDCDSFVVEADEYYFPDRNNARAFAAYVYQQMLAAAPTPSTTEGQGDE